MGRPKGSKNKKTTTKSRPEFTMEAPIQEAGDVTPSTDETATQEAGPSADEALPPVEGAGPADGAVPPVPADGDVDNTPVAETPAEASAEVSLDEHRADGPAPAAAEETVDGLNAKVRKLWHEREVEKAAASADAKAHSDEIKRIEADISATVRRIEELDVDEEINHETGIVTYRSRSTGAIMRTRTLDRQLGLPLSSPPPTLQCPGVPVFVPKTITPTFDKLVADTIWEHDSGMVVRIVGLKAATEKDPACVVLEDSELGGDYFEWTEGEWNANNAYPRERPVIEVGSEWREGETTWHVAMVEGDTVTVLDVADDSHEEKLHWLAFVTAQRTSPAASEDAAQ